VAEGREMVLCLFYSPAGRHVLDVNVVVHLAEVFFILGCELDADPGLSALGLLKRLLGGSSVAEANKAVAF
jgi:hypothetical protein